MVLKNQSRNFYLGKRKISKNVFCSISILFTKFSNSSLGKVIDGQGNWIKFYL